MQNDEHACMRACAGVGRSDVGTSRMWYRRNITIPQTWKVSAVAFSESPERLLLHFGAVDWEAEVFVNGQRMGLHRGGYVIDLLVCTARKMLFFCIPPFLGGLK